ncbi:MAG: single-stranded DNA-binding protein [Prevotella sp.]
MNNLTLIGRLGSEPVVINSNGSLTARISLGLTVKSGRAESETEWFEVFLWDSLAMLAKEYFHTGDKVYVYGHLTSGTYEDKEGNTHYVTRVEADEIEKMSTAKRNLKKD